MFAFSRINVENYLIYEKNRYNVVAVLFYYLT